MSAVVFAVLGFFLILGTAGRSDFADELGEFIALKDLLIPSMIGLGMMTPCFVMALYYGKKEGEEYDN